MRILFNNLILDDDVDLLSVSVSDNYPLENLKNRVLTKRTQSLSGDLNFTVTFPSPVTINCICFGYTNGTSITVKGITQDIEHKSNMIYFAEETLSTFDVSISGTEDIYLGGIAAGLYYQMPDPLNNFGVGIQDGNTLFENRYGITYQGKGEIINVPSYSFRNVSNVIKKQIFSGYQGVGSVVWIDPFEDYRDLEEPKYSVFSSQIQFRYEGREKYSISIFLKESN